MEFKAGVGFNGREAASLGIGIFTREEATKFKGQFVDYYHPSNGDKVYGVITAVSRTGYRVKDHYTGKVSKFTFRPEAAK